MKPGETAAAETVAGLQRKLQDLGIPLTQTLPEMPRRAAADAAPAEKTASELGAAVQQLRELQAQARALLEEAVVGCTCRLSIIRVFPSSRENCIYMLCFTIISLSHILLY